jgi:hypothetical protein
MAYVGVTRVRAWEFLRIKVNEEKENKIKNIVWKEVLLDQEDEEMEVDENEEDIIEID